MTDPVASAADHIDDDRFIITTALGVEVHPVARRNGVHLDISNPDDEPIILTADEALALAQFLLQSARWAPA